MMWTVGLDNVDIVSVNPVSRPWLWGLRLWEKVVEVSGW